MTMCQATALHAVTHRFFILRARRPNAELSFGIRPIGFPLVPTIPNTSAYRGDFMPRYMGFHTFPKNAFSHDQVCQLADAAQHDGTVKGYRSFVSPAEGRAVCIMDAEN